MNVWKLCITYSRSFRILAVVLISISSTQVHDVDYEHTECQQRANQSPTGLLLKLFASETYALVYAVLAKTDLYRTRWSVTQKHVLEVPAAVTVEHR